MVRIKHRGNFAKTTIFLESAKKITMFTDLDKYGRAGVEALSQATPVDTGLTASSWYYTIKRSSNRAEIIFHNSNIVNGVMIAMIIQYGHGTGTGGWVEGRDYINPAIRSVFDNMVDEVWKEVTSK